MELTHTQTHMHARTHEHCKREGHRARTHTLGRENSHWIGEDLPFFPCWFPQPLYCCLLFLEWVLYTFYVCAHSMDMTDGWMEYYQDFFSLFWMVSISPILWCYITFENVWLELFLKTLFTFSFCFPRKQQTISIAQKSDISSDEIECLFPSKSCSSYFI